MSGPSAPGRIMSSSQGHSEVILITWFSFVVGIGPRSAPRSRSASIVKDELHLARVLRAGIAGEVVNISVTSSSVAIAEQPEYRPVRSARLGFLRPYRSKFLERLVALSDPIVVTVGRDRLPIVHAGNGPCVAENLQLPLSRQVVADIVVVDTAPFITGVRIAYQDRDRHRRPGALAEDLAALGAFCVSVLAGAWVWASQFPPPAPVLAEAPPPGAAAPDPRDGRIEELEAALSGLTEEHRFAQARATAAEAELEKTAIALAAAERASAWEGGSRR